MHKEAYIYATIRIIKEEIQKKKPNIKYIRKVLDEFDEKISETEQQKESEKLDINDQLISPIVKSYVKKYKR